MPHVTEIELDSLRHLIGECELKAKKLGEYARDARDTELRNWCQQGADTARKSKDTLMGFLTEGVSVQ